MPRFVEQTFSVIFPGKTGGDDEYQTDPQRIGRRRDRMNRFAIANKKSQERPDADLSNRRRRIDDRFHSL